LSAVITFASVAYGGDFLVWQERDLQNNCGAAHAKAHKSGIIDSGIVPGWSQQAAADIPANQMRRAHRAVGA
jgi:hypothetical protein